MKPDTLKGEWMTLKHVLVKDFTTTVEVMQTLASDDTLSSLYPAFSKLSLMALVLPVSITDCERGFSTLKRIKNAPRNRLKTRTLDMLSISCRNNHAPPTTLFNFQPRGNTEFGPHYFGHILVRVNSKRVIGTEQSFSTALISG